MGKPRLSAYSVEMQGDKIVIQLYDFKISEHQAILQDALKVFLTLALEVTSAQIRWEALNDQQRESRIIGYLATDLKVQALLEAVKAQIRQHSLAVEGLANVAELGFPEFEDGSPYKD